MEVANGTYLCDCGRHFYGTFGSDEESVCPECTSEESETIQPGFDVLKPPTLEEIASIPYT